MPIKNIIEKKEINRKERYGRIKEMIRRKVIRTITGKQRC